MSQIDIAIRKVKIHKLKAAYYVWRTLGVKQTQMNLPGIVEIMVSCWDFGGLNDFL